MSKGYNYPFVVRKKHKGGGPARREAPPRTARQRGWWGSTSIVPINSDKTGATEGETGNARMA